MIKRNVRVDVPQRGTICWKHRDHYGSKFRIRSSKCMYPGHIESKRIKLIRAYSRKVNWLVVAAQITFAA